MADPSLGHDNVEKLPASMGAGDAPVTPGSKPAEGDAAKEAIGASAAAQVDDFDSTAIESLMKRAAAAANQSVPTSSEASPSSHLDQNEIDKLLADLNPQTRQQPASASASPAEHLSQEDVDKLLNDLDVPASSGTESEIASIPGAVTAIVAGSLSKTSALIAGSNSKVIQPAVAPALTSPATSAAGKKEGPLSQDDIDQMLAGLGARPTEPAAPEPSAVPVLKVGQTTIGAPLADATQALSPEELDRILAKQNDAPPGTESEAVIDQADIDALVKQLAQATGAPEEQQITDALAGKTADIERIQAEAGQAPGPEMTQDAVDINSVLGRTGSTATLEAPSGRFAAATVATVATVEWRAARYLLAAAVLLLGICSGALIVLTTSVHGLSAELRAGREIEHPPVDGYADKVRLAMAKLTEVDQAERARGVTWLEEIKRQSPDHAADVGIVLARHFRSQNAYKRAADEYAAAEEVAVVEDPRVLLEHADCLTRLGNTAEAIRQVYALLATEGRWLSERDVDGRPTQELERNRQAVADAYLVLGRLLVLLRESSTQAVAISAGATEGMHTQSSTASSESVPAVGGGH